MDQVASGLGWSWCLLVHRLEILWPSRRRAALIPRPGASLRGEDNGEEQGAAASSLALCLAALAAELWWVRLQLTGHLQGPWHRLHPCNSFLRDIYHAATQTILEKSVAFQCTIVSGKQRYLHQVDPVFPSAGRWDAAADNCRCWFRFVLLLFLSIIRTDNSEVLSFTETFTTAKGQNKSTEKYLSFF